MQSLVLSISIIECYGENKNAFRCNENGWVSITHIFLEYSHKSICCILTNSRDERERQWRDAYMKQEITIELPARQDVPGAELYCQYYSKSGKLGTRDVMLMIPGGPGNDHAIYDPPEHSIAKALFPYVDILLFDPRSCGKSKITKPEYSSLDYYMDDIEAIREYFQISPD